MTTRSYSGLTCLVLLLALAGGAFGKDLPRVLFLGDAIHARMMAAAAKELKGQVQLEFPKGTPASDTGAALARLDELLGDEKWDLIYFNFGIGDLFYKDPRTREIRVMSKNAGGVRVTSPEQYEKNLEALTQRLKATGTKLVFATTTPLVTINFFPSFKGNLHDANSEVAYNEIAVKVMARHEVPVNDMHAYVLAQFGPEDKHPGYSGYDKALAKKAPLHDPVVRMILEQLGES